jgi:DNA-binding response OmpR family regulator
MRILLVEDDVSIAAGLVEAFRRRHDAVDALHAAEPALTALAGTQYDLAIVDIGLPGMDGFELVRRVRQQEIAIPLMILTARDAVEDKVRGLNLGADDWLLKPFSLDELVARSQALVRRSRQAASPVLRCGSLELDLAARRTTLAGAALALTAREGVLLEQLMLGAPNVVAKDRLVDALGRWDREVTANAVEIYVSRLRAKLAHADVEVRTMRGLGYRLVEVRPAAESGA